MLRVSISASPYVARSISSRRAIASTSPATLSGSTKSQSDHLEQFQLDHRDGQSQAHHKQALNRHIPERLHPARCHQERLTLAQFLLQLRSGENLFKGASGSLGKSVASSSYPAFAHDFQGMFAIFAARIASSKPFLGKSDPTTLSSQ